MSHTHRFAVFCFVMAALMASGLACDVAPEAPDAAAPASEATHESAPGEPALEPGSKLIEDAIDAEHARLRNVEGREGILAEKRLYSLFDEELVIRDFFQDRRGGVFVDVGCAWPVKANNTFYLEKHLGWTGIGIDALSEFGPAWAELRPGSKFFSYLVTSHSGETESFFRSPDLGLSSTNKDLASGLFFLTKLEPEEIEVESITLDDLLDREGVEKIDLLAMDIEGHEPQALAGFDIDRFRPELVITEGQMLYYEGDRDPVSEYFEAHGYVLIEKYLPFDKSNRYYERRAP